ncbi:MAG: ABC transporter permease [bacterium]|nr:ABC transporter permease [bacterium]
MRKVIRIALREYLEAVKTKAFFIGIVVAPILMCGSGLAFWLLKDQVDLTDKRLAIIDHSTVVVEAVEKRATERNSRMVRDPDTGKKIRPAFMIERVEPAEDLAVQRLELSNRIRAKSLHAFLEIGPNALTPNAKREGAKVTYYSRSTLEDEVLRWLERNSPINWPLMKKRGLRQGLEPEAVDQVLRWLSIERRGLVSIDETTGQVGPPARANRELAILLPVGLTMLLLLMMLTAAIPLLNSVLEEKTLRIAEVMLSSVRPGELMFGKLLGNLGVSITMSGVYIIGGIIACLIMGWTEHVPFHLLPWFVVYMIAGIFMMGSMNMAVGAACNDSKELASLTFPAMLPMILPMFVMMPVLKEPGSTFSVAMSLFPTFTPTLMLLRQASPGGVPMWQPIVGLVGIAMCTMFVVWAAGRIFRIGLLTQGARPPLRDLLRWILRG